MDSNGGWDAEEKELGGVSSNPLFLNHAEIAWHERRRAWVGDKPRKPIQRLSEPLTFWNTTYVDLATPKRFPSPIPLPDMVNFLWKTWLDKGPST